MIVLHSRSLVWRLADGRAISFFDYDWVMEKVTDDQGLGSGFPV